MGDQDDILMEDRYLDVFRDFVCTPAYDEDDSTHIQTPLSPSASPNDRSDAQLDHNMLVQEQDECMAYKADEDNRWPQYQGYRGQPSCDLDTIQQLRYDICLHHGGLDLQALSQSGELPYSMMANRPDLVHLPAHSAGPGYATTHDVDTRLDSQSFGDYQLVQDGLPFRCRSDPIQQHHPQQRRHMSLTSQHLNHNAQVMHHTMATPQSMSCLPHYSTPPTIYEQPSASTQPYIWPFHDLQPLVAPMPIIPTPGPYLHTTAPIPYEGSAEYLTPQVPSSDSVAQPSPPRLSPLSNTIMTQAIEEYPESTSYSKFADISQPGRARLLPFEQSWHLQGGLSADAMHSQFHVPSQRHSQPSIKLEPVHNTSITQSPSMSVAPSSTNVKSQLRSRHKELAPRIGQVGSVIAVKERKGGRRKGSHLGDEKKAQTKRTREESSCARCKFQRVSCVPTGDPNVKACLTCLKSPLKEIGCFPLQLGKLYRDLLPVTVVDIHAPETIKRLYDDEVGKYRDQESFIIELWPGFGEPLRLETSLYKPKDKESLVQYQYYQNPATRMKERFAKYSPPLCLTKPAQENIGHLNDYLERVFDSDRLQDFTEMCYAAESQHEGFQERLLGLMCSFYLTHDDCNQKRTKCQQRSSPKHMLQRVLRMLILTYIMGHLLTIVEDTIPALVRRIKAMPRTGHKQISPRIANRQLKGLFSIHRGRIYKELLDDMQQLITANNKGLTWMSVFVIMLGFAMALEEVQANLHIQADTRARNDPNSSEEEEQAAALREVKLIEERFEFMLLMFRWKYGKAMWPAEGPLDVAQNRRPAEQAFLHSLRDLVVERRNYLEARSNTKLGHQYQCHYTSRLVAKVLLPMIAR